MMTATLFDVASMTQPFDDLDDTREKCLSCTKCGLSETRKNVVFEDGNPNANIMIIGEAPGQQEDESGTPFVGRSGQLLTKILESVGLSRQDDVYICNTVKCRPPENRVPTPDEKATCRPYLDAQIAFIKPKIILLCGATAVKSMMPENKLGITKIRGQWFDGPHDAKMMPIFHPSYLLRNASSEEGSPKWLMWQDIKLVKATLDSL